MLTAYAESDFKWDARSKNPTSSGHYSEGVFQQTLPWWPHDHFDVAASTDAFLDEFKKSEKVYSADPVASSWLVQRWNAPDPMHNTVGFSTAPETVNYDRRVSKVYDIIRERRVV